MKTVALSAQIRDESGKGPSRRLRAGGFVPAIFYGYRAEPMMIKVSIPDLVRNLIKGRGETSFVKLVIESGENKKVEKLSVLKDLQIDTAAKIPVHVDFYEIRMDRVLTVDVHLALSGSPVGLEKGGELQQLKRDIKVSGLPVELPESIEIDITDLKVGDSIKVGDLSIKGDVQVLDDDESVIVAVVPTRNSLLLDESGEEGGAAASSGSEGE